MSDVPKMIKVTFRDDFPLDLIDGMLETEFVGLSPVYRRDEPRVLYLQPRSEKYVFLMQQLKEFEARGALTFVEEYR